MSSLGFNSNNAIDWAWHVDEDDLNTEESAIKSALMDLSKPVYVAEVGDEFGVLRISDDTGQNHNSEVVNEPDGIPFSPLQQRLVVDLTTNGKKLLVVLC